MKSIICTVLLVLAWPRPQLAAEPVEPSIVELVFGWPAGVEASVTVTKARNRGPGQTGPRNVTMRYTMRAVSAGDDLRIQTVDPSFGTQGDPAVTAAWTKALLGVQIAELTPDYVVTRTGRFVRIDDLAGFRERVDAMFGKVLQKHLDSDFVREMRAMVTSEAVLTAKATEEWNRVVGAWVGTELELGVPFTASATEPIAAFPGQQIEMDYSFEAKRLLPCSRGGVERQCVELEMRSSPDPDATKRMIEFFIAKVAKELEGEAAFRSLDVENSLRLVTEPDGLIPHSFTATRAIRATVLAGGKEESFEQLDTTEASYSWP